MKSLIPFLALTLLMYGLYNYLNPQKEEIDDMTYFLTNSWELISYGTHIHSLTPVDSNKLGPDYPKPIIQQILHFDILNSNKATRFSTSTYLEKDTSITYRSSLDTGFYNNGIIHFKTEVGIHYIPIDAPQPPTNSGLLNRYSTVPIRQTDTLKVFKRERFGDRIIVTHKIIKDSRYPPVSFDYRMYKKTYRKKYDEIQ